MPTADVEAYACPGAFRSWGTAILGISTVRRYAALILAGVVNANIFAALAVILADEQALGCGFGHHCIESRAYGRLINADM